MGAGVRDAVTSPARGTSAVAERAIHARLIVVDLGLEVRDAHAPASTSFEPLRRRGPLKPTAARSSVEAGGYGHGGGGWRSPRAEEARMDGEAANRVAYTRPGRTRKGQKELSF